MLSEFLTWWAATLRELVPPALAGRLAASSALLVTPQEADSVALSLRTPRATRAIGVFSLDPVHARPLQSALRTRPRATILQLPPGLALARDVTLPLAAERQLATTIRFELDRLTPFKAEDLVWTAIPRHRDRSRNRLHVTLALVPRAAIQPLLDQLAAARLTPTAIEAPGLVPIPLDPPAPRNPRLDRALATLCALLVLATIATPFVLQSLDTARVDARIAQLRPQVDRAEALRRRLAATAAGTDILAAQRARLGNPLAILATLTDLLPDDTALTDLTLRQGVLTLTGQSAAAPRLIAALSADPLLRDPGFAAPVTKLNDGRADLFTIRADIAP